MGGPWAYPTWAHCTGLSKSNFGEHSSPIPHGFFHILILHPVEKWWFWLYPTHLPQTYLGFLLLQWKHGITPGFTWEKVYRECASIQQCEKDQEAELPLEQQLWENEFCFTQETVSGLVFYHTDPPSSGWNDSSFDITCGDRWHITEAHLRPGSEAPTETPI